MDATEWPVGWRFEYETTQSSPESRAFNVDREVYPDGATFSHRFELQKGDQGNEDKAKKRPFERAESAQQEEDVSQAESDEWWYSWSFRVPEDFPDSENVAGTACRVHLSQFQQFPEFKPPWMFGKLIRGPFAIRRFPTIELLNAKEWPLIDDKDFRGTWHDVYVHARWCGTDNGFLKVWIGDNLKLDYTGSTCLLDAGRIYFKYGIYRPMHEKNKPAVAYFSNLRRGKSRAEVELHSDVTPSSS